MIFFSLAQKLETLGLKLKSPYEGCLCFTFVHCVCAPAPRGWIFRSQNHILPSRDVAVSMEGSRDKCARVLGSFSAQTLHVTDQGTDPQQDLWKHRNEGQSQVYVGEPQIRKGSVKQASRIDLLYLEA